MTIGAAVVVAAADSLPEAKAKADLVCAGVDDQVELMESLNCAPRMKARIDCTPAAQNEVECLGRHSVLWLPGTYHLSDTLFIPPMCDAVIMAEGTYLSHERERGDAVVISGANRCRYRLGTIESPSTGAAIRVRPTAAMPTLMNFVTFTGLVGHGQHGTGLCLDPAEENVCVNRFEGTDIRDFGIGVHVKSPSVGQRTSCRPTLKADTNHYWFSYLRHCHTCIWEEGNGIDCGMWDVNVDATLPGAVAIRTAGLFGQWNVIMGNWEPKETLCLVLDPAAAHNVFYFHPPVEIGNHPGGFPVEDRSGNDTNVIVDPRAGGTIKK